MATCGCRECRCLGDQYSGGTLPIEEAELRNTLIGSSSQPCPQSVSLKTCCEFSMYHPFFEIEIRITKAFKE